MTGSYQNKVSPCNRRQFMVRSAAVAGSVAASVMLGGCTSSRKAEEAGNRTAHEPLKAFCIDFNWGPGGPAPPGMYAQADPAEHVRWYQELGANTIQTFCVSYNGYAWYPSEVAPVTPGLKHPDFLGDMVERGHKAGMRVMGYFNLGANPHWEQLSPELVHSDDSGYIKIPMTFEYLDYFCRSVEDTLRKTGVDGFMIDWVRPTQHSNWLDCEKRMDRQLLGEKVPGSGAPSKEALLEFDKRSMERAWQYIKWSVRATRPAIIWTNHPFHKNEYPLWSGHRLLKEVDWVLNESPDLEHLEWLRKQVGAKTLIVQDLCGWKDHDATIWKKLDTKTLGLYGFAQADSTTTLPSKESPWNIKNIEILREAYHSL